MTNGPAEPHFEHAALNWLWLLGARLDRILLAGTAPGGLEELLSTQGGAVERIDSPAGDGRAPASLAILLPDGPPSAIGPLHRALRPGGVLAVLCGRPRVLLMATRTRMLAATERRHYCLWPSHRMPRQVVPAKRSALGSFVGLPQGMDRHRSRRACAVALGLYRWTAPGHLLVVRR